MTPLIASADLQAAAADVQRKLTQTLQEHRLSPLLAKRFTWQLRKPGGKHGPELLLVCRDGFVCRILQEADPIRGEQGRPQVVFSTAITPKVHVELQLHPSLLRGGVL